MNPEDDDESDRDIFNVGGTAPGPTGEQTAGADQGGPTGDQLAAAYRSGLCEGRSSGYDEGYEAALAEDDADYDAAAAASFGPGGFSAPLGSLPPSLDPGAGQGSFGIMGDADLVRDAYERLCNSNPGPAPGIPVEALLEILGKSMTKRPFAAAMKKPDLPPKPPGTGHFSASWDDTLRLTLQTFDADGEMEVDARINMRLPHANETSQPADEHAGHGDHGQDSPTSGETPQDS